MKYIFVINPAAGIKDSEEFIRAEVKKAQDLLFEKNGEMYECNFYTTKSKGDATEYVKAYLECHNEDVCFVACGGDGTLYEVVNGASAHRNAYVSVYPCGSGNDFVKYYGGAKPFLDITGIFEGSVCDIDIMKAGNKYSINICNFGFDTAVVKTMEKVRRFPVLGGNNSYYTGIATALFTAMKNKCRVYADGELLNPDGHILLCTLGNGSYVGGSFNCSPKSDNTDGLMEVCLVSPISLPRFLKLLPHYTEGTHLDSPGFEGILKYVRAKEIRIEADDKFLISLDGELVKAPEITVENIPNALHFIVPRDAMITPAKHPALVN